MPVQMMFAAVDAIRAGWIVRLFDEKDSLREVVLGVDLPWWAFVTVFCLTFAPWLAMSVIFALSITGPLGGHWCDSIYDTACYPGADRGTDCHDWSWPCNSVNDMSWGVGIAMAAYGLFVMIIYFALLFRWVLTLARRCAPARPDSLTRATRFARSLARRLADKYGIRRYGFHGTSYRWLTEQAAAQLGKDVGDVNLVLLHLGAGASMCAVKGGKCLDTTMVDIERDLRVLVRPDSLTLATRFAGPLVRQGLTPTAGLVMATRCGDIDPSVVAFLVDKEGMTADEVESVLNYESGLVGMCGLKDIRDVHAAERRGEAAATEALEVYVARIRGYLGSYVFQLGGRVDAVVFSAGVGEHDAEVRRRVLEGMEWAGLALDEAKNDAAVDGRAARIDRGGTVVPILVVPTDEERSIAMQVIEQLG